MYTFFYNHAPAFPLNTLSQHHPTPLTEGDLHFATSEHYMMYHKAALFDPSAAGAILAAPGPTEAKRLGRGVRNFNPSEWDAQCDAIVERGNYLKFTQNPAAWAQLDSTSGTLVEAARNDRIWGIGFDAASAKQNRERWGQNRLGKILTRVRKRIREEKAAEQGGG